MDLKHASNPAHDSSSGGSRQGGYRPERPIQVAPLFRSPLRFTDVLKWLFGFPGYLWPWQAFFIGLAWLFWRYLTPELETMKSFSPGWVAGLYVRNLALLAAFAGAWHAWLYVRKAQGTAYKYDKRWLSAGNSTFLFKNQLWDNLFWTVCSGVPIWTAYEALTLWLQANGYAPTVDWAAHPLYCTLLLFAVYGWLSIHFYSGHRLPHWRPFYRLAHHLHHKNVNVGPWSGLAMHPIEHVIYFSAAALLWFIPSHPVHGIFLLVVLGLTPTLSHLGFDRLVLSDKVSMNTEDYMHFLHHKYVQVNFGGGPIPLDKWLGTFHDGSDESFATLKRRLRPVK